MPLPVVTPEQAIEDVAEDVAALVTASTLDDGEANALTSKLEAAQHLLDRGDAEASTNLLGAFINRVEAMGNSSRLTVEQAQSLIDLANATIALITPQP